MEHMDAMVKLLQLRADPTVAERCGNRPIDLTDNEMAKMVLQSAATFGNGIRSVEERLRVGGTC